MAKNHCSAYPAGQDWVLAVDPAQSCSDGENVVQEDRTPIAIHFVIDNSGSMGTMTREVRDIFADMVDSVATVPCSLTLFASNGTFVK